MPVNRLEIHHVGVGNPVTGDLVVFKTGDTVNSVEVDGYFDGAADLLKNGGWMLAWMADGSKIYRYTTTGSPPDDVALTVKIALA